MNFTVTVAGLDPLVHALNALAAALRPSVSLSEPPRIAHADRPDAGAPFPPAARPLVSPELPLALAALPEPTLPAFAMGFVPPATTEAAVALVPPPPVPSTAAVAPPPTAPVDTAAPATLPPPPPVASLPAPPTVNAAAVPTAPVAQASPVPGAVDTTGLPWDSRIHASNQSTNKDGTWRQKRGTAETYVIEVTKQLRAALAANAAVGVAPPPTAAAALAAIPAPATGAALPPPPAAPACIQYGQLAMKISPAMVAGTLSAPALNEIVAKYGLQNFNQAMHAPAIVPALDAELSALLGLPVGVVAS